MILLLALLSAPPPPVQVDVIELNHVYSLVEGRDEFGRLTYSVNHVGSYFVLWSWYPEGLHVRDWIQADKRATLDRDTLTVVGRKTVTIRGQVVRERASMFDAEQRDQQEFPTSKRRLIEGLRR